MSGHLSSVEISEWLAGIRASEAERHLAECAACAAELERASQPLARFGLAMRAWCAAETPVPRLGSIVSAARRRRQLTMMRVALAAAAVLVAVLMVAAPVYRQHQRALRTQLKTSFALVVDQLGRGLPLEPFANPALVQPGLLRQRLAGHRARSAQRLIQSHPVAEIDHCRHQSTTQNVENLLSGLLRFFNVDFLGCAGHIYLNLHAVMCLSYTREPIAVNQDHLSFPGRRGNYRSIPESQLDHAGAPAHHVAFRVCSPALCAGSGSSEAETYRTPPHIGATLRGERLRKFTRRLDRTNSPAAPLQRAMHHRVAITHARAPSSQRGECLVRIADHLACRLVGFDAAPRFASLVLTP